MKYVSLFSGIEAASVAWEPLGMKPLAFSEIEPFPCAVLAHRYPEVPNLGDITKVDWSGFHRRTDIVVGGSPCQSFSIAGKRTGLHGESGLMWEYVRCVSEVMPRWLVWENVPGALSSARGEDFRCLLHALDDLGYGLAWRVLDAQFFGVPQRRRRVFLVGSLGDTRSAEVLFESDCLCWGSPSSREKRETLARGARQGAAGGLCAGRDGLSVLNHSDPQSKRIYSIDGVSPTLPSGKCEGMNIKPSIFAYGLNGQASSNQSLQFTEISPTLQVGQLHDVLCMADTQENSAIDSNVAGTLTRRVYKDACVVCNDFILRRITPLECERLQGFPDRYTDIPYKGKEHPADTPRYKALGNSMAVPVMRWIGERLMEVN